jgi:hypothetical protein
VTWFTLSNECGLRAAGYQRKWLCRVAFGKNSVRYFHVSQDVFIIPELVGQEFFVGVNIQAGDEHLAGAGSHEQRFQHYVERGQSSNPGADRV